MGSKDTAKAYAECAGAIARDLKVILNAADEQEESQTKKDVKVEGFSELVLKPTQAENKIEDIQPHSCSNETAPWIYAIAIGASLFIITLFSTFIYMKCYRGSKKTIEEINTKELEDDLITYYSLETE